MSNVTPVLPAFGVGKLKLWPTLALLLALLGFRARAQTIVFPRYAPFTGTDASGFKLGGNARLTAGGTSPADAANNGVLRLTNATGTQAGYAIDNFVFATPNGFSISFEFFAYGTTSTAPADGFSVFLVDGTGTDPSASPAQFTVGASGGSLGYAQKTSIPGASKGYLGIGIDEFGNYSAATEGRIGGPGVRVNAVALRGPYDATDATKGYEYLTGTTSLAFNLAAGGTTRTTDPTAAGYRKAYINVIPVSSGSTITYRITVRIQNGQNLVTTVNNFAVTNPPATLRVGFAASTGGSNSVHEIRDLQIVQAPIANDDQATTKYNAPVTINVLANDQVASGSPAIAPATVDLNPATVAIDNTYTVVGQGTFTVTSGGVVTFTPIGTFTGTVSIPYTVNNTNGNISNPANIEVTVTGADVASAVSGPATASPGSTITYTVTTTDNGREIATNVIPTLQLASGLVLVSASLPTGATYNSTSGLVTFAQTTLAAGASATNAVQVTVPAAATTGTIYSSTASYTYPSGQVVPDAVAGNNSASIPTQVGGLANVATVCATPGKDGPVTLTGAATPNTYYPGVTATAGNKTLTVGTTPTGSATAIAAGDLLLIMQMQGATLDATNTTTYGTASAITAGQYEYAVAAGAVGSGGALALVGALGKTYTNADPSTSVAQQRFQVVRVPQYSALTLTGTVRGLAWNNATGGVLALDVAGQTTFSSGGTLNMSGAGFRGGASAVASGTATSTGTYVANGAVTVYARKGESIAGQPIVVYDGTTTVTIGTIGYASTGGSLARGGPANGGGGGNYGAGTAINAGGGGGANGGAGSTGAFNTGANGGIGGRVVGTPAVSQLYLGGGGGAGTTTSTTPAQASGGVGGGIIILNSGTVSGTATINASGAAGLGETATSVAGGGGGGAGGTVVLTATSGLGGLTVLANGGAGGTTNYSGGGGGGGAVYSSGALASAASVAVGAGGTGGGGGAVATNTSTTSARGATCVPALSATLQATTPQVTRVGSSVRPATYVLTVSNTGGGLSGLQATAALATNSAQLFAYTTTTAAVLTYADGTTKTLVAGTDYTAPTANSTSPAFALNSSLNVPAGASVAFTFTANIANTAANSTAYASNAAVAYLSPTRATATATAAGTPYTSAGGTSPDVVTIVAPLPVELTNFVATAVGADALLSWRTAQELNNHHFDVERSLDGRAFQKIGALPGHGTTGTASDYRYTDAGAAALGGVLYYRLRQVDNDGAWSLAQPVVVQCRRAANVAVALFPNPATGRVTLDLTGLPAATYAVQVLDLTGRVVQHYQYQPGPQPLDVQALPTGTYFVRVQGGGVSATLPLLRQ